MSRLSRRRLLLVAALLAFAALAALWPRGETETPMPLVTRSRPARPPSVALPRLQGRAHARSRDAGAESASPEATSSPVAPEAPDVVPLLPPAARLPIRVETVDAETGSPLGAGRLLVMRDVPAGETGAGPRELLAEDRGRVRNVRLLVDDVPEGWLTWDAAAWAVPLSAYAERLVLRYPLRREARIVLDARDPHGAAVSDAVVPWVSTAGRTWSPGSLPTDVTGRPWIRGVPWFRGEQVRAWVRHSGGRRVRIGSVRLLGSPEESIPLSVVLPRPSENERNGVIGIGGGAGGGAFGGRGGRRRSLPPTGTLDVRVLRYDGTPAVGATVTVSRWSATTDAEGRARLENVLAAVERVTARQVGLLPVSRKVTVPAGGTVHVLLQEPRGVDLALTVVDERARPLPFARIDVDASWLSTWTDVSGGTQRIDPFTDVRGERTLSRLPPGIQLRVSWGSRSSGFVLTAEGGPTQERTLVLAPK